MSQSTKVFALFGAVIFLLVDGRLNSGDGCGTLDAAVLVARHGSVGSPVLPSQDTGQGPWLPAYQPHPADDFLWIRGSDGLYYESHEVGGLLVLLPSAWLGLTIGDAIGADAAQTTELAKITASFVHAIVGALGCLFVYWLFQVWYEHRKALALTAVFATCTIFWAYTKTFFDVFYAGVAVAYILWKSADVLTKQKVTLADGAMLGTALAIAALFRFSLAPFLGLGLLGVCWFARSRLGLKPILMALAVWAVGLIPLLYYNYVRMGSPLTPANTSPQYAHQTGLGETPLPGLLGLTIHPSRGLFVYSPILLLLFLLPWMWRRLPQETRQILIAFGPGMLLYVVLVSWLKTWWGSIGWGPRYLVPLLPLVFLPVGFILTGLWSRYRVALGALLAISFLLSLGPVITNSGLQAFLQPQGNRHDSLLPRQHMAVWRGVSQGIRGINPAPPADFYFDGLQAEDIRRQGVPFPDAWWMKLMRSPGTAVYGWIGLLGLAGLTVVLLIWTTRSDQPEESDFGSEVPVPT